MKKIIIAMITMFCGLVGCSSPTSSFGGQADVGYLSVVSSEYKIDKKKHIQASINDQTPFNVKIGKNEQFEKAEKYVIPTGKIKIEIFENGQVVQSKVIVSNPQETTKIIL